MTTNNDNTSPHDRNEALVHFDPAWLEDFDHDAFRARLKNAYRSANLTFSDLVSAAGVTRDEALKAIDQCAFAVERWLHVLGRFAVVVGRDLKWLLTGQSTQADFMVSLYERNHTLIDEYIYMDQIPEEDQHRLHRYADLKMSGMQARTAGAAYRKGIALNSWRDVAELYQEMLMMHG
jgi:hypothetical protein